MAPHEQTVGSHSGQWRCSGNSRLPLELVSQLPYLCIATKTAWMPGSQQRNDCAANSVRVAMYACRHAIYSVGLQIAAHDTRAPTSIEIARP